MYCSAGWNVSRVVYVHIQHDGRLCAPTTRYIWMPHLKLKYTISVSFRSLPDLLVCYFCETIRTCTHSSFHKNSFNVRYSPSYSVITRVGLRVRALPLVRYVYLIIVTFMFQALVLVHNDYMTIGTPMTFRTPWHLVHPDIWYTDNWYTDIWYTPTFGTPWHLV